MRNCSFVGCQKPHKSLGFCNRHYKRLRAGLPLTPEPLQEPSEWLVEAVRRWGGIGVALREVGLSGRRFEALCHRYWRAEKHGFLNSNHADDFRALGFDRLPELLPSGPMIAWHRAHGPLDGVDDSELWNIYGVGSKRGGFTVEEADELAVRRYGVHPYQIWGEDWWAKPAEGEMEKVA